MRDNAARPVPRPLIIEMGGKNPAIVMRDADLDKATDGVMRSAFGAQGQKCSACSRVYIQKDVRDAFVDAPGRKPRASRSAIPLSATSGWDRSSTKQLSRPTCPRSSARRRTAGKFLIGGKRITEPPFDRGYFVEPTIIDGLPPGHPLFSEELFVPITVIADVMTLDEALATGQPHRVRTDRRHLLGERRRPANVLRAHPGGRHLRQSPRRRDDWRMARRQSVRGMESQRIDRPRNRRALLRATIHARTKPSSDSRRLTCLDRRSV